MTATWTLPIQITAPRSFSSSPLVPEHTRVVVPTYRDWDAARETIESLLACNPLPGEIVLVNDNVEPDAPAWARRSPIHLVNYPGNRGPSFARNAGVHFYTGRPIDWLYFTDTGCTREPLFFECLQEASLRTPNGCVAVAGPVRGVVVSPTLTPINHYMTVQEVLNPPFDAAGPQAVVTANAAVAVPAFAAVSGFDLSYPFAAAEDLDLGLKLRRFGAIAWARDAIVYHRFSELMHDHTARFVRYGRGSAHLAHQWRFAGMRPRFVIAHDPRTQHLADAQALAMQAGYDSYQPMEKHKPIDGPPFSRQT